MNTIIFHTYFSISSSSSLSSSLLSLDSSLSDLLLHETLSLFLFPLALIFIYSRSSPISIEVISFNFIASLYVLLNIVFSNSSYVSMVASVNESYKRL